MALTSNRCASEKKVPPRTKVRNIPEGRGALMVRLAGGGVGTQRPTSASDVSRWGIGGPACFNSCLPRSAMPPPPTSVLCGKIGGPNPVRRAFAGPILVVTCAAFYASMTKVHGRRQKIKNECESSLCCYVGIHSTALLRGAKETCMTSCGSSSAPCPHLPH